MVLIIGGFAAGKMDFAANLGYEKEDIFQLFDTDSPIEALLEKPVVIVREMGCGLVPVDRDFRMKREEIGRLACKLAESATDVYRVSCGIGTKIK
ncbi:MAG: hypothetical protein R3Y62_03095 [Eubacteriales bacterium]